MRSPQQRVRRSQVSRVLSVSAPVGGWNARDPLAEMKPVDAIQLDNFFCTPYDVVLRNGFSNWATGISGTVNSLASYSTPAAVPRLYAAAGANIYDVTIAGAVGTPVVTGLTSDKWQHINFGTAGGNFLVLVNGSDAPLVFDGTAWVPISGAAFNSTVTSLTSSGTIATITMSVAHGLATGRLVVMAGFTQTGYNGTYAITVTSTTKFTYVLTSALAAVTAIGTATPLENFTITGVTPSNLIHVTSFKGRLWFTEKNSTRVWYLPPLSIGGAAQSIDFSSLWNQGGYLMAMGDWTLDAGQGMDDYAVFISSNGQVAVYKGTDPSSITTWALVGVFDIGSPIGRRCLMKYAGDLTFVCQDGLAPLSKALMSTRVNSQEMLSDKIQHVISDYITQYQYNFGWEAALFATENILLVNVPVSNGTSYQLVMNTISGAWSRFLGWNASCFEAHGNLLYFGASGTVCKAWDTNSDNGTNINFEAQQSFNYFGSSGQLKQVKMVRPIISTDGAPNILLGVNADFDTSTPTGIPTFTPIASSVAIWDGGTWDSSVWGGEMLTKRNWQTAFALGFCLSAHMKGYALSTRLRWAATDYLVTAGGVI